MATQTDKVQIVPQYASASASGAAAAQVITIGVPGPTGPGVPPGGTTGQALVKKSDTAFDTEWATVSGGGGGSGTVTSVAVTVPNLFTVAGSPITTAGTITLALATQAAKTFLAGPISGANAAPTMRTIAATDLPFQDVARTGQVNTFAVPQTFSGGSLFGPSVNVLGGGGAIQEWFSSFTATAMSLSDNGSLSISGSYIGDGSVITNLDAANIASGTLPDARLSANVPLLTAGKLSASVLPALAISEFLGTVASQAAMLALVGQRGDWCVRTDDSHTYFLTADDPTLIGNWQAVVTPGAPVTAVNGQTGNVTLAASDVGAQPADAELTALAGLTSAADQLPYFTGSGTAALATISSASRSLLATTDAAGARTVLGLGTLATKSSVSLTTDVTGTLPSGNLPTTVVYGDVADIPHRVGWVLARGTPATVGTNKAGVKVRLPYAGTFKKVWVDAETGPTGAALILDIKLNGTSLWATTPANRPQIAAGATAGTQTAFDTTTFAAGDYLTIDIAQVGSTIAGQDIAVGLDVLIKNQ